MQQYLPGSEHSIDGEKQAMEVGETVVDYDFYSRTLAF